MRERSIAIVQSALPVAQRVGYRQQRPERPAGPPEVPARLEDLERPLPRLERVVEVPGDEIDVGQAAFREGAHVVLALAFREGGRLAAVGDGHLGGRAGEAVEKPHPAEPGQAARRVGVLRERADRFEGLDVLGVLA